MPGPGMESAPMGGWFQVKRQTNLGQTKMPTVVCSNTLDDVTVIGGQGSGKEFGGSMDIEILE